MAVGGIIQVIKAELKCTLCLDHFKDPKNLHCLHTFCKRCLVPTVEENTIVCPLCRHVTDVSSNKGVDGLASNFLYSRMIDIVHAQADSSADEVSCGNCDGTGQPTSYCFECICFLCEDCLQNHNRIKSVRERHRVTELVGLSSPELQRLMRRSDRCKQHKENAVEFYCSQCERCVCKVCSRISHKGHSCSPLRQLSAKRKEEIETTIAEAERRLDFLNRKKCAFEDKASELKQEVRTTEEVVHRTAERLIRSIRHHELAMVRELKIHQEQLETAVASERSTLNSHLQELEKNLTLSRDIVQRANEAEIVELNPSIVSALRGGDESVPKMAWRLMHADYAVNKDVFNLVAELGRVVRCFTDPEQTEVREEGLVQPVFVGVETHFTITTRNLHGHVCHSDTDRVSVEVTSTVSEVAETNVNIHNQGGGSYRVTIISEYPGQKEVHIKINDEEVPRSPFPIMVSFLSTFAVGFHGNGPGQLRGPTGVAVNKEGEQIAVSDSGNKRVQLFDKTGKFVQEIAEYFIGGKRARFGLPAGVAYDELGNLAVVDQLNDKVVLINPVTKNMVNEFGGSGDGHGRLNRPWGVFIDVTGRIIVSDTDNDCVQVFNHDGEFMFMFGENGSLNGPDSALFHKGIFFVSDSENHCLKVFDDLGNYIFQFGKEGYSKGQLRNPTGLCVYKESTILVCDYRNDRVQIFTMDGKFVHAFGSIGTAMGQFSWPEGVATLRDGSVLVADSENNRIQKLK